VGESRDAVLVLAGFALLSALLICAAVGRALRPLEDLSTAFERIGNGDYHGRMPEHGPRVGATGERLQSHDPAARRGRGTESATE
jgi:HAMP domain-containing protein